MNAGVARNARTASLTTAYPRNRSHRGAITLLDRQTDGRYHQLTSFSCPKTEDYDWPTILVTVYPKKWDPSEFDSDLS